MQIKIIINNHTKVLTGALFENGAMLWSFSGKLNFPELKKSRLGKNTYSLSALVLSDALFEANLPKRGKSTTRPLSA